MASESLWWKHFHWFNSCVLICFINSCNRMIDFNRVRFGSAGEIEFRSYADRLFVYSFYTKAWIITWTRAHVSAFGRLCEFKQVKVDNIRYSKHFSCLGGKRREMPHFLLHLAALVPANLLFKNWHKTTNQENAQKKKNTTQENYKLNL